MVRRKDSKNRVLKEGESERKNGTYEYKYRDNTGKRKSVYAKTLDELREKEKSIERDLTDGIISSDLTVYQLVEEYLSQKSSIKYNTMQCYKCALRRLKDEPFSATKIDKVKPMDLKSFFKKLQEENGLGFSSIDEINKIMKPAFRMAVENDLIRKNPFQFSISDVVKNESQKREAITKSQMESFLQFIKEDKKYSRYYNGIYILFHTGLRISELCGLTLRDVDLKERTINVDHQLYWVEDGLHIEDVKSESGERKIPMTDGVYAAFKKEIDGRKANDRIIDGYSGFIFVTRYGEPVSRHTWDRRFRGIRKAYNESHVIQMPDITPHICRHTFCSNMAKSGMNPKTLQYIMGHSKIGVTLDIYTHLGVEDAREELLKIDEEIG